MLHAILRYSYRKMCLSRTNGACYHYTLLLALGDTFRCSHADTIGSLLVFGVEILKRLVLIPLTKGITVLLSKPFLEFYQTVATRYDVVL